MRTAARMLLVVVTLVFLASMGGGMAFVWWVLVPLHWLAARNAGPVTTAAWALLAAASVAEVAWMVGYVISGDGVVPVLVALTAYLLTAGAFLVARAQRVPVS